MARRIPSLDGLRAVSIALVLAAHAVRASHAPFALQTGELGVRIFFAISGYLITTLLLSELQRTGDISLRRFYLRRTFRIFPAYYAYLAVASLAVAAGWLTLLPGDAWHAFTYTTNYHPHRAWALGHSWSLAVEEQFYLLWPAVLVLVGARRGLAVAAGFIVAAPLLRVIDWFALPGWHELQGESFWTIGDAIALGCVLAMVRPRLAASTRWLAFERSRWFTLVPLVGVASYVLSDHYALPSFVILQTITGACIVACIDRVVRFPDDGVGRMLNWPPLVFVGELSYSLYLWQQPFMDRATTSVLATFPLNLALAFAAALASYHLVEQPMLRLREQIEVRAMDRGLFGIRHEGVDAVRR